MSKEIILDYRRFVFCMDEVKQNYYSVNSSNANMLHPGLYGFVSCPEVRRLIAYYDKQKFDMRQIPKGDTKKRNNWGLAQNSLHQQKTFVGGFQ